VVDEHVLDRLEPDEGPVRPPLRLVCVVVETALCAVEDEPPSFPQSDGGARAELGQVAVTGAGCELDV